MKNEKSWAGLVLFVIMNGLPAVPVSSQEQGAVGMYRQDINDAFSEMDRSLSAMKSNTSPMDEYYIGRAVGANILKKYKPYMGERDIPVYLNKICYALALHAGAAPFNGYHVMILDSPEMNAFATSGGHIFISRGLAEAVASEDMLAAVIAHEIAHIQLRHGIAMIREDRLPRDMRMAADRAGEIARRDVEPERSQDFFADSIREIADTLLTTGFSQQQEFEADSLAVSLLAAAGYEPSSLIDMLRVLKKVEGNYPGGLRNHPPAVFRIANVERIIKNYPVPDTRSFRVPRFNSPR
jgi:predicted Zn-dependent protease